MLGSIQDMPLRSDRVLVGSELGYCFWYPFQVIWALMGQFKLVQVKLLRLEIAFKNDGDTLREGTATSRHKQNIIGAQPADDDISAILVNFDAEHVHIAWQKALERRNEDPEAAITMARTLIESVCKHILDEAGVSYSYKDDLPKLYRETAKQLNMAPEQHQEKIFKQILGGCQTVIQGLGTLRNQLSDAHGKGKKAAKPSARHAALAVNLAGSMAAFLVATWEERSSKAS